MDETTDFSGATTKWISFVVSVIGSSTFASIYIVLIILNPELRRLSKLFLTWNLWQIGGVILFIVRVCTGIYHSARITIDLWLFIVTALLSRIVNKVLGSQLICRGTEREELLTRLEETQNFEVWKEACLRLDLLEGTEDWKHTPESDTYDFVNLQRHTNDLRTAREKNDITNLMFLLRTCCSRSFCNLCNPELYDHCRIGTKKCIEVFHQEVCSCLIHLRDYAVSAIDRLVTNVSKQENVVVDWLSCDDDVSLADISSSTNGLSTMDPIIVCSSCQAKMPLGDFAKNLLSVLQQRLSQGDARRTVSSVLAALQNPEPEAMPLSSSLSEEGQCSEEGNKFSLFDTAIKEMHTYKQFFSNVRLSMGRTALCLSGGGALAMYHIGVVRLLVEQNVLPRVVSGTSGGSIVAGILAISNDSEILDIVTQPEISSRYGKRWFPPLFDQLKRFVFHGHMIDTIAFRDTCKAYYQDWTFAEAYKKTGRLVSLVVSPSSATRVNEPLILNWVNTPEVLIWSAVAASCALPGLMKPCEIYAKDAQGKHMPYYPTGMTWMDGSIKLDIPHKELGSLFNVKKFIVSQVNPHAAPFVKASSRKASFLRNIENWLTLDMKNRYSVLAQFNMVPKIFGQNITTFWMSQNHEGHITITPRASLFDWYRIINHPSVEDMKYFIAAGRSRTFPHISRIQYSLKIEECLRECWAAVEKCYTKLKELQVRRVDRREELKAKNSMNKAGVSFSPHLTENERKSSERKSLSYSEREIYITNSNSLLKSENSSASSTPLGSVGCFVDFSPRDIRSPSSLDGEKIGENSSVE